MFPEPQKHELLIAVSIGTSQCTDVSKGFTTSFCLDIVFCHGLYLLQRKVSLIRGTISMRIRMTILIAVGTILIY